MLRSAAGAAAEQGMCAVLLELGLLLHLHITSTFTLQAGDLHCMRTIMLPTLAQKHNYTCTRELDMRRTYACFLPCVNTVAC
jgi:hypothetical protein